MKENAILLTPPKYLNDPWEFHFGTASPSDAEIEARFNALEQEDLRKSGLKVASPERNRTRSARLARYREHQRMFAGSSEDAQLFRERMSERFGIISLSTDPLNRLMWAHYAQNSGIVIGFDCGDSHRDSDGLLGRCTPLGLALEVRYRRKFCKFRADTSNEALLCTTKHIDWRYEREWRVIDELKKARAICVDSVNYRLVAANPGDIAHVIFGMYTDDSLQKEVRRWLTNSIPIEQAYVDRETQELCAK